jgi:3-oxoacyl-[acyl-carrier-protein] synthase II
MLKRNRAVVTGLGVLAPNGNGKEAFWTSLVEGRSGIGPITLFDAADLPCRIAGEVKGFDPLRYIDVKFKPHKRMARAAQMAVAAAKMALDDAGLTTQELQKFHETPVVMGVSTSAMDLFANAPTMFTAMASVPHAVGSAVAYTLGFESKLFTISNGCASGVDAVAAGAEQVCKFNKDVVLAGASDGAITRYVFEGFCKSRKLSLRNDHPEKASRPFDRDRDGGIISEGAGIVVIENRDHALARGAHIYAEITGYGTSADPPTSNEAAGMADAMRKALASAYRSPSDIGHISAHAPSDQQMDAGEIAMIRDVFGGAAAAIPITSVKGATGNAMAVGGIHQTIAAVLSLEHGLIPPTANLENLDPACDLDCVSRCARTALLESILVNTHGFGRGNSSLIVERAG